MENDTTQSGVSKDEAIDDSVVATQTSSDNEDNDVIPALVAEPTLSQRDESVSDIVANARENRGKETGYMDDEGSDPDEASNISDDEDAAPTIKVDGEVIAVSQDEIDDAGGVTALQKERSAANKMRVASASKIEQDNREADIARREQAIAEKEAAFAAQSQQQAAAPAAASEDSHQPSVQDADADLTAEAKLLAEKIYSGEEDQAEEAILSILKRNQAAGRTTTDIDANTLRSQVTQEVRWGIEKDDANRAFAKEYPKLKNNPTLRNLVNEETKRIVREHPEYGPRDIIMTAAKNIDKEFKAEIGDDFDAGAERNKRKQSMDSVTGANTRRPKSAEKKPLSRSEIVAQTAALRSGQQN